MDKKTLKDKVSGFPETSGVYLMKNEKGVVLYIGKAKSLKDRVTSYFSTPSVDKVSVMFQKVSDFLERSLEHQ